MRQRLLPENAVTNKVCPHLTKIEGKEGISMLYYALVFLVIAIIAGLLGFGVVAFAAAGIAKILFVVFLILFLLSLFGHTRRSV